MSKKVKDLDVLARSKIAEHPSAAGPERDLCVKCGLFKTTDQPFVPPNIPPVWSRTLYVLRDSPIEDRGTYVLQKELAEAGYTKADIAYDSAVKCLPPNLGDPTMTQIRCCRPFIRWVLDELKPELVLGAGGYATKSLTNDGQASVTKFRGRPLLLEVPDGVLKRD